MTELQGDQVVRLACEGNVSGSSSQLDLDLSAVWSFGIVARLSRGIEGEPEGIGGDHFADATNQMAVKGELAFRIDEFRL